MTNRDKYGFDVEIDGTQGRRSLRDLAKAVGDFERSVKDASAAVDSGNSKAAKSYRGLVEDVAAVAKAEQGVETAVQNRVKATEQAKQAKQATGSRADAGYLDNELRLQRALNAEAAGEIALRQQRNRDLESGNRISLLESEREAVGEQRAARQADRERRLRQEQETRINRAIALEERENQAQVRGVQQELTAQQRLAQAEADRNRRFHEYQDQSNRRISEMEQRDLQRIQRVTNAEIAGNQRAAQSEVRRSEDNIYNDYLAQQNDYDSQVQSLNSTRYALYDVAAAATVSGAAMIAAGGYAVKMAADYEYAMDGVQRAAELTGPTIQRVKDQLIDLTTDIPTNFDDIAGIAQLGAQMNIAGGDLDEFSSTVSRFTSTTNASIDTTAQTFGRLSNLLDVPSSQFENLGSAIAKVGVESVATETEILSVTQQISGAAAVYGFTADQVVGLGAAFSSLAIAPEAARGSVTRIFGDIEKAVATGGDELREFARIMGTDMDQASMLWKSDPSAFFQKLVSGLSRSTSLIQDLEAIGARDVRDQNLLQRLAGSTDVLNDSLRISQEAYADGGYLQEAYAVQTDNLQSKLQVLTNTFNALAATTGGPLNEALKVGVDILQFLLDRFRSINPTVLTVVAAIALIVGGFLLLKGAQAAAMAGLLAVQAVLRNMGAEATITSLSFRGLAAQAAITWRSLAGGATATSAVATGMNNARAAAIGLGKSLGVLALLTIGFEVLNSAVSDFQYAMSSSADKAQAYFGDLGGLGEAMKADTEALRDGGEAIKVFQGALPGMTDEQRAAKEEAAQLASVLGETGDAAVDAADKAAIAGLAFGDASIAFLRGQLAQSDAFKEAAKDDEFVKYWQTIGADVDEVLAIAATDGEEGVRNYFSRLELAARDAGKAIPQGEYWDVVGSITGNGQGSSVKDRLDELIPSLGGVGDVAQGVANEAAIMGEGIGTAADQIDTAGDAAEGATDKFAELRDSLDGLFSGINLENDFYSDVEALYTALEASGGVFNSFSEEGRKSFSALQDTMLSTIMFGESIGLSAQDSLLPLFKSLQEQGIDTTVLLQQLASSPIVYSADLDLSALGAKLASVGQGIGKLSTPQSQLNNAMNVTAGNARRASDGLKKMGGGAAAAKKEIVTLSDYVDDLGKVMSMAFDFRFGSMQALDNITGKWAEMAEKNQEAVDKVRDFAHELDQLAAKKPVLEYQLEIALKYGDNLRAEEIQAELNDINKDMADKAAEAAKAQAGGSKELQGGSQAAIENRNNLLALVKSYTDYIKELANTNMSQEQLAAETARLKQEFISQAIQMGYSEQQVYTFSAAFDDITVAINNVPRNINVAVDANPAIRALDEIKAKKQDATSGANMPITSTFDSSGVDRAVRAAELTERMNDYYAKARAGQGSGNGKSFFDSAEYIRTQLKNGQYAKGGFVPGARGGNRGVDDRIGMLPSGGIVGLQGGEPIINNHARDVYGDQMFKDINSLKFRPASQPIIVNSQSAGIEEAIVHFSPEDRMLLDSLRTIVNIGDQVVTDATNRGNGNSGRLGRG